MEASIELYRICLNYIALYIGELSLVTIDIMCLTIVKLPMTSI